MFVLIYEKNGEDNDFIIMIFLLFSENTSFKLVFFTNLIHIKYIYVIIIKYIDWKLNKFKKGSLFFKVIFWTLYNF